MSYNSTKFLITDRESGSRLDIVLVKLLPGLSRSNLKKIIELKQVKINDSIVDSPSKKLKENDNIENIEKRISSGTDIFERPFKYKKIDLNEEFPQYILENRSKFKDWIL